MHLFMFFFVAVLFYVLTPGVLLSLPPKGSKMVIAMTHAIVFSIVWTLIHKSVWEWGVSTGMIESGVKKKNSASNNYMETMVESINNRNRNRNRNRKNRKI